MYSKEKQEPTLTHYYYALLFSFNPTKSSGYWDRTITHQLKDLYENKDKADSEYFQNNLKVFISCMQANLNLEWHGIHNESVKGKLSNEEKDELRYSFYREYREYTSNIKNEAYE